MSNVAAFNIRPGKPIFVEENAWNINDSTTQLIVRDMLCTSPRKYASWPTTNTDSDNGPNIENVATENTSILLSSVSSGAKAIIRATPVARQALPCVHEGFLQNYSKVRKQIIEAILSVLKRQVDKSVNRCRHGENSDAHLTLPKIYITGHSMGGSLAQLLGLDLASNCEILIEQPCADDAKNRGHDRSLSITSQTSLDNGDGEWLGGHTTKRHNFIRLRPALCVYTYGQPRVGNAAFKKLYKQRVPHTFRVCTEGDAFTSMPTVGPCCGGIYRHAGLEVLLDEGCTGNILVGPTVVETLLRFTKVRTSLAAHSMERYRESLESALGRDELKEYYQGHGGKASQNARWHQAGNKDPLPSWVTSVKRSHGARY